VVARRLAVVALPALPACADFSGSSDAAHGLPDAAVVTPDFDRDVQPLIERRCAIGGCHTPRSRQAGLVLVRDSAWDALVGRPSRLRGGEILVRAGDAANSWLLVMIDADAARRGGLSRMPLASGPLTPNQITTIANWIDQGAERP
jgi:hypothetical protein